jgi:hypothetical protein
MPCLVYIGNAEPLIFDGTVNQCAGEVLIMPEQGNPACTLPVLCLAILQPTICCALLIQVHLHIPRPVF